MYNKSRFKIGKKISINYLFQNLSEGLVVGGNDGAVVVLEVLVNDASPFPDAESTEAVSGASFPSAGFDGLVIIGSL
jgi:hypothetical protein